jgi:glycerophosphoryl diester phosphodiesterase
MLQLPKVIGHRGAAAYAPENTLESFREARRRGATWVETDIKLTADGVPIVMHDESLKRTTGVDRQVAKTPRAELPAGVPTFEEAIACFGEEGLGCNVEIKPCPGRELVTAEFVMRELQRLWPAQGPKLLISSFAYQSLQVAHRLAPEFPRAVLVEEVPENWQALCEGVEAIALNPWHKTLTPEWTKAVRKAGYKVISYTVNETPRARELFDWGVDAVFSDVPGQLLKDLGT